MLRKWLQKISKALGQPNKTKRSPLNARLYLEPLEARWMPSTFTWTGLGTGATANDWTNAQNWGGTAPSAGADLVFAAGAAQTTNTNNFTAGTSFHSISFTGTGSSYVLNGNSVVLSNANTTGTVALNTQGGDTNTINFNITAATALTINAGDTSTTDNLNGILILNGSIAMGANALTFGTTATDGSSNGIIEVGAASGGVISGSGSVNQVGTGTTYLFAADTYTGTTNITNGILVADNNSAIPSGTGANDTVTVGTNNGSVAFTATSNSTTTLTAVSNIANLAVGMYVTGTGVPTDATIVSISTSADTITLSAATTRSGTMSYSAPTEVSTSTATLAADYLGAGTGVTISSKVAININGTGSLGQGAFLAGNDTSYGGTFGIYSTEVSAEVAQGNFTFSGGWGRDTTPTNIVIIQGPGSFTATTASFNFDGGDTIQDDGIIIADQGITLGTSATATGILSGTGIVEGNVTVAFGAVNAGDPNSFNNNSGTLSIQPEGTQLGTLTLDAGGTLEADFSGSTSLLQNEVSVSGALTIASGAKLEVNLTGYTAGSVTTTPTFVQYASVTGTFGTPTYINPNNVTTSGFVYTLGASTYTVKLNNAP